MADKAGVSANKPRLKRPASDSDDGNDESNTTQTQDGFRSKKCMVGAVKSFRKFLTDNEMSPEFESYHLGDLDRALARFYTESRQENGEFYRKTSLYALRNRINRHLSAYGVDIVGGECFKESKQAFKAICEDLKQHGKDLVEHAPPISQPDLKKLYLYFDLNDNVKLQEKVFVDLMLYLFKNEKESRGRYDFRNMNISDFVLDDDVNGLRFARYKKCDSQGVMYERPGDRFCPYTSFVKYIDELNMGCPSLFQRPSRVLTPHQWYEPHPLGHNTLGNMTNVISERAGLSRRYTNSSLIITSTAILDSGGVCSDGSTAILDSGGIRGDRVTAILDSGDVHGDRSTAILDSDRVHGDRSTAILDSAGVHGDRLACESRPEIKVETSSDDVYDLGLYVPMEMDSLDTREEERGRGSENIDEELKDFVRKYVGEMMTAYRLELVQYFQKETERWKEELEELKNEIKLLKPGNEQTTQYQESTTSADDPGSLRIKTEPEEEMTDTTTENPRFCPEDEDGPSSSVEDRDKGLQEVYKINEREKTSNSIAKTEPWTEETRNSLVVNHNTQEVSPNPTEKNIVSTTSSQKTKKNEESEKETPKMRRILPSPHQVKTTAGVVFPNTSSDQMNNKTSIGTSANTPFSSNPQLQMVVSSLSSQSVLSSSVNSHSPSSTGLLSSQNAPVPTIMIQNSPVIISPMQNLTVPTSMIQNQPVPISTIQNPPVPIPNPMQNQFVPKSTIQNPPVSIQKSQVPISTIQNQPVSIQKSQLPISTIQNLPTTIQNPSVAISTVQNPPVPIGTIQNPSVAISSIQNQPVAISSIQNPPVAISSIQNQPVAISSIQNPQIPNVGIIQTSTSQILSHQNQGLTVRTQVHPNPSPGIPQATRPPLSVPNLSPRLPTAPVQNLPNPTPSLPTTMNAPNSHNFPNPSPIVSTSQAPNVANAPNPGPRLLTQPVQVQNFPNLPNPIPRLSTSQTLNVANFSNPSQRLFTPQALNPNFSNPAPRLQTPDIPPSLNSNSPVQYIVRMDTPTQGMSSSPPNPTPNTLSSPIGSIVLSPQVPITSNLTRMPVSIIQGNMLPTQLQYPLGPSVLPPGAKIVFGKDQGQAVPQESKPTTSCKVPVSKNPPIVVTKPPAKRGRRVYKRIIVSGERPIRPFPTMKQPIAAASVIRPMEIQSGKGMQSVAGERNFPSVKQPIGNSGASVIRPMEIQSGKGMQLVAGERTFPSVKQPIGNSGATVIQPMEVGPGMQLVQKDVVNTNKGGTNQPVENVKKITRHPAPPPTHPTPVKTKTKKFEGMIPPAPDVSVSLQDEGILVSWTYSRDLSLYSDISRYQLFSYQEGKDDEPSTDKWKMTGELAALPLPMACRLADFVSGYKYHFIVRAVDVYNRFCDFSDPVSLNLP